MAFDMSDYVDVAARIQEFREKHPEGSLQPADPSNPFRLFEFDGERFIAYAAAAYRTPDDPRPGIGCAWEPYPGKTSFTKDSELQNAETSAWGRAIVAVLAADTKRGVASAEEVRNRATAEPRANTGQGTSDATEKQRGAVTRLLNQKDWQGEWPDVANMTKREASEWIDKLKKTPDNEKSTRGPTVADAVAALNAKVIEDPDERPF